MMMLKRWMRNEIKILKHQSHVERDRLNPPDDNQSLAKIDTDTLSCSSHTAWFFANFSIHHQSWVGNSSFQTFFMLIKKSFTSSLCLSLLWVVFYWFSFCLSIVCHHHCRMRLTDQNRCFSYSSSEREFRDSEIYATGICYINQLIFSSSSTDEQARHTLTILYHIPSAIRCIDRENVHTSDGLFPFSRKTFFFSEGSYIFLLSRQTRRKMNERNFSSSHTRLSSCSTCAQTATCFPPSTIFSLLSTSETFSIWRNTQNKWKFYLMMMKLSFSFSSLWERERERAWKKENNKWQKIKEIV